MSPSNTLPKRGERMGFLICVFLCLIILTMSDEKDLFYLDKVFPEPDKIFSADYKRIDELYKTAVFVFDTNALLVPFDTSEKNLKEIKQILIKLKNEKRLFIPSRVAREFAKNRATKLGELFLSLRQLKGNLNSGTFKISQYPLLDGDDSYSKLKDNFEAIVKQIGQARSNIESIEQKILGWSWNDSVSLAYKEIFTSDTIESPSATPEEIEKDLKFRFAHRIAPGYKDSNKIDDGVGDLVIWHTILAIGKKFSNDVIFISNDEKNDWFHKQDKVGMYPKFELYDEFRRSTGNRSFSIISFLKFLELSNAKSETLEEVKQSITESSAESRDNYQRGRKDLVVGLTVAHPKFGVGKITRIFDEGINNKLVIDFPDFGSKTLLTEFAKIHVLDTSSNFLLLNPDFGKGGTGPTGSISDHVQFF